MSFAQVWWEPDFALAPRVAFDSDSFAGLAQSKKDNKHSTQLTAR